MKKKVLKILIIVIVVIVSFFGSFFIAIKFLDMTDNKEENNIKNNVENIVIEETVQNGEGPIDNIEANSFEGIVEEVDIDKKQITVVNPSHLVYHEIYHGDYEWRSNHKVIIEGKIYVKAGYLLCLDNVPIKEDNGNKIEVRDLKAGDTIKVRTINVEYTDKIIFEPLTSDNIVLIEKKI